ncbi:MAG: TAXI family TRAP transporter solute-binding subunit [bacterium]|nr:TAXI family TRAP transporter solute-binding subunit [bacterium]
MRNKTETNLKPFKAAAVILSSCVVIYFLLLIFAPQLMQRSGAYIRDLFGAGKKKVVLATAGKGGHYYRLGKLLKQELRRQQDQTLEVNVTLGSLDNVRQVQSGAADFAFIQGGLEEGPGHDFNGLNAVATIGWQYVHIITPVNSGIQEFNHLKGKTVSLGPRESGNASLGKLVLDYFHPSAGVKLEYTDIYQIERDFRAGKMDAVFTVYDLHARVVGELLETGDYRLIPIHGAESIAYTIPGCFSGTLPHSLYGRNRDIPSRDDGIFPTLKVKTLLISHREMDGFIVKKLLRTLYSTSFIKQSRLPELDEKKGRVVFDLPLHPEADEFYRRNDPVTADKYEIGSALLAALLFIASVLGFIVNRFRARELEKKKQNIIPYFEELLKYSRKMAMVEDINQLKELLERMMAMQRRAENQWLSGDLDTEHMENLYYIYGIRCGNAFNKMTLLQLRKLEQLMEPGEEEKELEKKDPPVD